MRQGQLDGRKMFGCFDLRVFLDEAAGAQIGEEIELGLTRALRPAVGQIDDGALPFSLDRGMGFINVRRR